MFRGVRKAGCIFLLVVHSIGYATFPVFAYSKNSFVQSIEPIKAIWIDEKDNIIASWSNIKDGQESYKVKVYDANKNDLTDSYSIDEVRKLLSKTKNKMTMDAKSTITVVFSSSKGYIEEIVTVN